MALDQWFAQWFAVTWPNIRHIFTFFSCIFLSGLIQEGISLPTSDGCCSLRTSTCSIVEKVRREGTWKRFCGRLHGKQVSNLGQFGSQIYDILQICMVTVWLLYCFSLGLLCRWWVLHSILCDCFWQCGGYSESTHPREDWAHSNCTSVWSVSVQHIKKLDERP